jgi:rod shape-determining protein MreC
VRLSFKYLLISAALYILAFTGIFTVFQGFTQYLANPFQYGLFQLKENANNTLLFFIKLKDLRTENLQLLEKNYDLESKLSKIKEIENENKILREQAGVKNETSAQNLLLARVIGIPFNNENSEVMIDRGEEDGLKVGQTVIYKGFLVGSVVDVFAHRATVVFVFYFFEISIRIRIIKVIIEHVK